MLYHPPTLTYKGLTIVLNNPSRFDTKHLISGNVGDYFDKLIMPFVRLNCEIRLASDTRPYLPGTKLLLLLGQESLDLFKPGASLATHRGSPLQVTVLTTEGKQLQLTAIPTFAPQDTFDRKDYEHPENTDNDDEDDDGAEKDYQKTRRKNYRFWLHGDVRKAIRILKDQEGKVLSYSEPQIVYCPPAAELVRELDSKQGGFLTVDIETDRAQNLTCFSVLWASDKQLTTDLKVYVIPFKTYTGALFYSNIDYCRIFRGLSLAFQCNTVVGHNLQFDNFVLLWRYRVHLPKVICDTMVRHHRLHPEVEKSLGHCVSYYTDLPYHKDEGVFDPKTPEQQQALWRYNAKDVITTFLIFCEQEKHLIAAEAVESARQGCAAIRSLLAMQLEGCLCDTTKLCKMLDDTDQRLELYSRVLSLLTKREFNPRSSQQVSKYLYLDLKLPKPATKPTDKENLFKLYAKYQLPSLRLILAYRVESKRASTFRKIRFWKENRFTCAYAVTGTDTFRLNSRGLLGFK